MRVLACVLVACARVYLLACACDSKYWLCTTLTSGYLNIQHAIAVSNLPISSYSPTRATKVFFFLAFLEFSTAVRVRVCPRLVHTLGSFPTQSIDQSSLTLGFPPSLCLYFLFLSFPGSSFPTNKVISVTPIRSSGQIWVSRGFLASARLSCSSGNTVWSGSTYAIARCMRLQVRCKRARS